MKQVPFYANHDDGMHCTLAVYRSVLGYFLGKKMSWTEMEAFTGYQPGRVAWTPRSLVQFAAMGFDIRMIEPFDYREFAQQGVQYLQDALPPAEAQWQLDNSNVRDIIPLIPDFLAAIAPECRQVTLADIDGMLDEGRLVFVKLNSRALNGEPGFNSHAILVIGREDEDYIAHDPGLPPQPYRRISRDQLWLAMGGDESTAGATGFKLKARRNLRLDQYVVEQFPLLSRAFASRLIGEGKVLVNGKPAKAGHKLRELDDVTIDYDESQSPVIPDIDLPVLYEDDDCIVINKPAGVLTHSVGRLNGEATVASFLRSRLHGADGNGDTADTGDDAGIRNAKLNSGGQRGGIVHRLDRPTSGLIICAKTPQALAWLQRQFHDRAVQKVYTAVIAGQLEPSEAIIDMPIERNPKAPSTFRVGANGKPAITRYKVLRAGAGYSLLELKPETGRTHQLRVHLAHQNHPIVGDYMYGGEPAGRLYLHAYQLTVTLPNGENRTFTADIPPEFARMVEVDS